MRIEEHRLQVELNTRLERMNEFPPPPQMLPLVVFGGVFRKYFWGATILISAFNVEKSV